MYLYNKVTLLFLLNYIMYKIVALLLNFHGGRYLYTVTVYLNWHLHDECVNEPQMR